jgi:uncharacterized membrane protein/thiol-disulfide isomerase/thioredoxin
VRRLPLQLVIFTIAAFFLAPFTDAAQSVEALEPYLPCGKQERSNDGPVVKVVLFYSPTCPHCHHVISDVLVPMVNDYGDQLQIVGIDTSQADGAQVYQAAIERYQIPPERRGVPTLVVGDVVLVGGLEIPEHFPALFEEGLATGGIDWPDIPGLTEMLSEAETKPGPASTPLTTDTPVSTSTIVSPATTTLVPSPSAVPQVTTTLTPCPTAIPAPAILTVGEDEIPSGEVAEPAPDPVGFTLAGVVLAGMAVTFSYATLRVTMARQRLCQFNRNPVTRAKTRAIPFLVVLGLGVAAYLAYVEVSRVEAVCGPVGECNIVQGSAYAVVLGVPVAVWGVLNYLAVGVLWAGQRHLPGRRANLLVLGLLGLTLFGTLFSIYLTCLELFVIRAICAWCLSSAVITTIVMLLVLVPVTGGLSLERTLPVGGTHEHS